MSVTGFNRRRRLAKNQSKQTAPSLQSATDEEREALAAEYEELTGKKAGKMKVETLRKKLAEAEQAKQSEGEADKEPDASEPEQGDAEPKAEADEEQVEPSEDEQAKE